MIDFSKKLPSRRDNAKGKGLINSVINKLPIELHLPGYQYCGPGTKLKKRLARGDPGINLLDQACKEHDLSYSKVKNTSDRHIADKILYEKAWQRVKSKDANIAERANALLITNLMKAKVKLGMGCSKSKRKTYKSGKGAGGAGGATKKLSFRGIIKEIGKVLKRDFGKVLNPFELKKAIQIALSSAKKTIKKNANSVKTPRVIPVPKTGGAIPFLLPIFAGLSALGALSGGVSGVYKAVNDVAIAKKELEEKKRHNQKIESIAVGHGLNIKPYRKGLGLYLQPQSKNS